MDYEKKQFFPGQSVCDVISRNKLCFSYPLQPMARLIITARDLSKFPPSLKSTPNRLVIVDDQ